MHRLATLTLALLAPLLLALPAPAQAAASVDPLAAWRNALAASSTKPANIVWLGSSTTYGNNATSPEKRYVNLVTNQLRQGAPAEAVPRVAATYPTRNTSPGVHGYLSAAGGTTSETYVNNGTRPWILWERPSLIVHMIGSNDSIDVEPYAVTPAEYEAAVGAEVDRLTAASAIPVSHMLVHTYRRSTVSVEKWAQYRDALERVAATRDNVAVVDISAPYEAAEHLGQDPMGLIDADGVHQTDAGHAFMADLLVRLIPGYMPATGPAPVEPSAAAVTAAAAPAVTPPVATSPAPAATRSPLTSPRRVQAVERAAGVRVTWQRVTGAASYVVKCGGSKVSTTGLRALVKSEASRCKVRAVADGAESPWRTVRVRA